MKIKHYGFANDDSKRIRKISQDRSDSFMFKAAQRMMPLTNHGWRVMGIVLLVAVIVVYTNY